MNDPAGFVRAFLDAIERGDLLDRQEQFYCPDAVQIEWPNRLMPDGAVRDLDALRAAGRRGAAIVESQSYEIVGLVAQDDRIAVEAIFRARFHVDVLDTPAGETLEARFAMFFELSDGRIRRHGSYDCFMPRGSALVPPP